MCSWISALRTIFAAHAHSSVHYFLGWRFGPGWFELEVCGMDGNVDTPAEEEAQGTEALQ